MSKGHDQTLLLSRDDALQNFEASIIRIAEIHGDIEQVAQQILAVQQKVGHALTRLRAGISIQDAEAPADAKIVVKETDAAVTTQVDLVFDEQPSPNSSKGDKQQGPAPAPIAKGMGDPDLSEIDSLLKACDLPINGTVLAKRQRLIAHARLGRNFMPTRRESGGR